MYRETQGATLALMTRIVAEILKNPLQFKIYAMIKKNVKPLINRMYWLHAGLFCGLKINKMRIVVMENKITSSSVQASSFP